MKVVIVALHEWDSYEFYLQSEESPEYSDIRKRAAEVIKIKFNLPTVPAPESVSFSLTVPFDDPRETEVIDKDLWVFEPSIALATPASTNKQIAGKPFAELREMVKDVITDLKRIRNQNCSVPVRGSTKSYTVATIITELENLTVDGLTFLNDWLINAVEMEIIRMEK
jgi:hypothetical protein